LAIHFEWDLSFKFHHKTILNKSYKMLGFIKNTYIQDLKKYLKPKNIKSLSWLFFLENYSYLIKYPPQLLLSTNNTFKFNVAVKKQ